MKRIVIIGGMGPQASVELHHRIIEEASRRGARNGGEFPEIVHLSVPIDDFISDQSKIKKAIRRLESSLSWLYLEERRCGSHCL